MGICISSVVVVPPAGLIIGTTCTFIQLRRTLPLFLRLQAIYRILDGGLPVVYGAIISLYGVVRFEGNIMTIYMYWI
jgi:hypothetical protein